MTRSVAILRILLLSVASAGILGAALAADPTPAPPVLPLERAVQYALENNPQLNVARTQRGLAAAGVVLARIYPYNPVYTNVVQGVIGHDVTNRVFNEHYVTLQIELFHQRRERMAAASAAVTRVEWEIAGQELATAVNVVRAYNTVLYRQQKLQVLEDTVHLNDEIVDVVRRLVDLGRNRPADLIVARSELDTARAQRGQGKTALAVARNNLRIVLGTVNDAFSVAGELDCPLPATDTDSLVRLAVATRPELQARTAAIHEAEARLQLQIADRFGNPSIGPRYEINETKDSFVGVYFSAPIAVINRRQGEIAQRQAELTRAHMDLRATEVGIVQAVQAAKDRLTEAHKWADVYPAEVLPDLEKARKDMEQLFSQGDASVNVISIIGVQRNLLRARDAYLDALFEVSLSKADVAAAVGDPALATGCQPAKGPDKLPPPQPR
jgi:outer membrane protein TolC